MFTNIQSKKIKYALGLIGAILIGAIGSGIWVVALGPAFSFITEITISFLSLLFSSLENSIYESVAKGYSEESSSMAVTLILYIFSLYLGYSIAVLIPKKSKEKKSELDKIGEELTDIKSDLDLDSKKRLDEIENRLNLQRDKLRKIGRVVISFLVVFFVFIYIQSIVLKYKINKISNYEQKIKTVKPFISQNQYDLFNSSFAQIKNSSDYDKLINSIKVIALQKNIKMK